MNIDQISLEEIFLEKSLGINNHLSLSSFQNNYLVFHDGSLTIYSDIYYDDKINEIIDAIFYKRPKIKQNCSRAFIFKKLDEFYRNQIKSNNTIKAGKIKANFNLIISELKKTIEYGVVVFIKNLNIVRDLKVGRITIKSFTKKRLQYYFGYIKHKPSKNLLERIINDIQKRNIHSFVFCIIVANDEDKAYEKAINEVENALNLIRLAIGESKFGIDFGYLDPMITERFIINIKQGTRSWEIGRTGNILPYILDQRLFQIKRYKIYRNLNNILKKDDIHRSDMEKRIITSLKWFCEVLKFENDKTHNVLRAFISLESLLLDERHNKGVLLSERIPFLISSKKINRERISEIIKQLYSDRNRIIHEGTNALNERFYNDLIQITKLSIRIILTHIDKITKLDDWKKIVENNKFVGKISYQKNWKI